MPVELEIEKDIGVCITGGGTTTGRTVLGMWKRLEDLGVTERVKVIQATSIGAYMIVGASRGLSADEVIERSMRWTLECSATPNTRTRDGFFDPEAALEFMRREILEGGNPNLNDGAIPLVITATDWSNMNTIYYQDVPVLEALDKTIRNPLYFGLEAGEDGSLVGDGGITGSVGADFLRKTYGVEHVILLDVQSRRHWDGSRFVDQPIRGFQKRAIQLSQMASKLPIAGQFLRDHYVDQIVSALVHLPDTIPFLDRASDALLTRIVDLEIAAQKPDIVIRAEDVMQIKGLGHNVYEEVLARRLIEAGIQAVNLQKDQLVQLGSRAYRSKIEEERRWESRPWKREDGSIFVIDSLTRDDLLVLANKEGLNNRSISEYDEGQLRFQIALKMVVNHYPSDKIKSVYEPQADGYLDPFYLILGRFEIEMVAGRLPDSPFDTFMWMFLNGGTRDKMRILRELYEKYWERFKN